MDIKSVIKYLIITFVITYVCWWGVAALVAYTDFVYGDILPTIIYIIGNFGPAIAALFCIDYRPFLRSLKKFLFSYKKHGMLFFLLFVALVTLTVGLSSMEWNPQMTALNFLLPCLDQPLFTVVRKNLVGAAFCNPCCQRKLHFRLQPSCAV